VLLSPDIHRAFFVMSKKEAQSSSDALQFRQGALDAAGIHRKCPQFRILIIGKANAGKTTILRKVCNAKPDAKPIIYDAKGKKVTQGSANVRLENLTVLALIQQSGGHCDSHSCWLRFWDKGRDILRTSSTPLLWLGKPKTC